MTDDPYADLRAYLHSINAPTDAMNHITKVLGWDPPPIWEAPRAEADAINQAVEVPDGMRHVGWYCEHPLRNQPPFGRVSEHRRHKNNKRGYVIDKTVGKALTFGNYDSDIACPYRVPVYINDSSAAGVA
jgi:hypothetical protein